VLLVGQSLLLFRGRLARALAARDAAPLLAAARAQVEAGAEALDLNAGRHGRAGDLAWVAAALRPAQPGLPLWLDAATPEALAGALRECATARLPSILVANALAVGAGPLDVPALALLEACARTGAGLVVSPRDVDARDMPATAHALAEAARAASRAARSAGVAGPVYLDALAWPPASDPARCARSLATLRLLRDAAEGVLLVAVGNVGHGLAPDAAREVRRLYAASAVAAGAGALILPVEDTATVRAVRLATGEAFPADPAESYLATVGAAVASGEQPHPPPAIAGPALRAAWRLLFEG